MYGHLPGRIDDDTTEREKWGAWYASHEGSITYFCKTYDWWRLVERREKERKEEKEKEKEEDRVKDFQRQQRSLHMAPAI